MNNKSYHTVRIAPKSIRKIVEKAKSIQHINTWPNNSKIQQKVVETTPLTHMTTQFSGLVVVLQ